jgi:antitoxin component of MazEF toxin-antitoxin module
VTKRISKFDDSPCILFDKAFMKLARLEVGDQMNVELHTEGKITFTPINPRLQLGKVTRRTQRKR